MADNSADSSGCPFWLNIARRCTASADGLFIPDENHITGYCTSQEFTLCTWYRRELQPQNVAVSGATVNRRNHSRIPVRYPVVLRYANQAPDNHRPGSGMVDTINFSNGGLQVVSPQPLFASTLVRVIYGSFAETAPHEDLVLVRWCHYHQDTMNYRAGLSFHSQLTGKNRRLYGSLLRAHSKKIRQS